MSTRKYWLASGALIGKWILFVLAFSLCFPPMMSLLRKGWLQMPTELLLISTLTTAMAFVFALVFSPLRRSIKRSWAQFSLREEVHSLYARPFSWLLIGTALLAMLALSQIGETISSYLLGLLPASWGIDTTDSVVKMLQDMLISGVGNRVTQVLSICVLPAIAEELFFRRGVQRLLIASDRERPIRAIVVTSIIFSLVHFSLVGLLSRTIIGFVLGYVYYRTGRLSLAILLHFLNNLVSLMMMVYLG